MCLGSLHRGLSFVCECVAVGHLAFQCRNDVSFMKDKEKAQATESLLRQKEMESDDEVREVP